MLDVFFNPSYGKLYEQIEGGAFDTFEYAGRDGTICNMYIKRPVSWLVDDVQYYDVTTPYGYGGPVVTAGETSESLIAEYYTAWAAYCRGSRIIAEFVRFHLYDNADLRLYYPGEVIRISDNVVRSLTPTMDEIWMEFEHKVRKNVKRAQNNGLTVTADATGEHLSAFLNIYYKTMKRNRAKNYYYFETSYFEDINRTLNGQYIYFHVWHNEQIISTELVLYSQDYAYSFLGGTLEDFYPMRPNDLLKYEIIKWCKETGRRAFILGGGYHSGDGIYRYKKAFAPGNDVPFYIGRKVFQSEIYHQLIAIRAQKPDFDSESQFFPLYRS
ncbi:MAG: GNAT family N-acetyltransferase [Firmicutes bacterium HGW-Firmicutes-16]|nr:MAG: GNAT family N-acetyltransferase [Firmicutes bacterium HGW-Firmicutes-16]